MTTGILGLCAGTWLTISAFVWHHTPLQMANAIVCGILVVLATLAAIYRRAAPRVEIALAVWIFASSVFSFSIHEPTLWNNILCAVVVLVGAGGRARTYPGARGAGPIAKPPEAARRSG